MSAQLQFSPPPSQREPLTLADLDAVMAIEQSVYPFAWSRGNFIDSLAAGYSALEFDLDKGTRGSRHLHCTGLLTELIETRADARQRAQEAARPPRA